jgi:hypothetical protein
VGCLLVLLFAAFMAIKNMDRSQHLNDTINVNEAQIDNAEQKLGAFETIEGSAVMRAPLQLKQEYPGTNYSVKGTVASQNYLFFDPVSHASHWLITGNRGLILEAMALPAKNFNRQVEIPVEAVVYTLVDTDSNGDGKLSDADLITIAISDPNGKHFARLLTRGERVNGARLSGKGMLVVLYTAAKQLRAADVDLSSGKVVRESVVKS